MTAPMQCPGGGGARTFRNLAAGPRSINPAPVSPQQELLDYLSSSIRYHTFSAGLQPIAQRACRCCRGIRGSSGTAGVVNSITAVAHKLLVLIVVLLSCTD